MNSIANRERSVLCCSVLQTKQSILVKYQVLSLLCRLDCHVKATCLRHYCPPTPLQAMEVKYVLQNANYLKFPPAASMVMMPHGAVTVSGAQWQKEIRDNCSKQAIDFPSMTNRSCV